ncbi:MAG: hypothetical protein RQ715_11030 [Methylococcales bacterium]|nr:hypothetical protein [Methylococcales bacterium]
MLTCKQASQLASKALDAKLTFRERMALGSHLLMCKLCRDYRQDLRLLRQGFKRIDTQDRLLSDSARLSEQSKQRIAEKLHQQTQDTETK